MGAVITIPKELIREKELILIPRSDYEEFLRLRERREWEEKDTDEAIKIFKKERKQKQLVEIKSLRQIK